MLDDNRHNAADSRFSGPVPHYLIHGKLRYVW
ncbi:S26 family signal peptidase [Parapedobacter pyrenivorans]